VKIWRWVLTAALATALLTGCGMLQASLTVLNNSSSFTIDEVRLTPSAASEYLIDVNIPPSGTHVVESVWAGTYDLHAVDSAGGRWERQDYVMQRGIDYAWSLDDADRLAP